jgi:hypothetical protein
VLVLSFWLKYGAGTVVSLLVRDTPVFLKSPRHLLYFAAALGLTHFSPGDVVFRKYRRSPALQAVTALAGSFYKLRKLLFIVRCVRAAACDLSPSLRRAFAVCTRGPQHASLPRCL